MKFTLTGKPEQIAKEIQTKYDLNFRWYHVPAGWEHEVIEAEFELDGDERPRFVSAKFPREEKFGECW